MQQLTECSVSCCVTIREPHGRLLILKTQKIDGMQSWTPARTGEQPTLYRVCLT